MKVLVRWCRVDQLPAADGTEPHTLTEGERTRFEQFRQLGDRQRFIGARLLLRQAVADAADCEPHDVGLSQVCDACGGSHGRPFVTIAGRPGPDVSMAHSGALAIVAVASRPVGVDIELDHRRTPGPVDLRTWVRTEAVLKATGHGLNVDPRLIQMSAPGSPPKLLRWDGPGRRPVLRLADVDVDEGYLACVALTGRSPITLDARSMTID